MLLSLVLADHLAIEQMDRAVGHVCVARIVRHHADRRALGVEACVRTVESALELGLGTYERHQHVERPLGTYVAPDPDA